MNKKLVFYLAIPLVLVASWLDNYFLGIMSWKNYLFQCVWEYTIFWTGFWFGERITAHKQTEII